MLYYLSLPFFLILFIALQLTVSDIIFSGRLAFEASLVVVIYAGFHLDIIRGVVLAFILGLILDCVGGAVPGLSALVYVMIFLCSFFISDWLDTEKIYVIAFFSFFCALAKELILTLFYYLTFKIDMSMNSYSVLFMQALIIGMFAPVFFYLMTRLEVFLYEKKA